MFENKQGYLAAFSEQPDPAQLTVELGQTWKSTMMILKLAPVHALAQFFIHAINQYRDAGHEISPSDISKVVIRTGPTVMNPSQMETHPNSLVAAQFSVPFGIALSLARDLRNPMVVDDSSLSDPDVLGIAENISFERTADDPKLLGGTVVLTLGAKEISLEANDYPGFPGSAGYAAAAHQRFDRVLAGLGKQSHAAAIRDAVSGIAATKDAAQLRDLVLAAAQL